ncbi:MAG: GMC family oxidoreductase N-terminal domain-containing protein [Steroidobacteraceae bacterium]
MSEFDYIIAGAGSAGCVLANRLTADGRCSVLLLEAGGSDRSPWISVPLGYGKTFTDPHFNWKYSAQPDPGLANRQAYWPRGKVLGGSSSINAMVYVRGHRGDFDDWAAAGNPGWGYADVLSYFMKSEDHVWGASEYHGAGGPMHISEYSTAVHPLCHRFIASCGAIDIPPTDDFNGAVMEGAGTWQMTIRAGRRESSASAFLRPALRRANLQVLTRAHATRLTFTGRRASGIEYLRGGQRHTARARREVIVCAGAVNSPQLLQLSGIGDESLLRGLGIPVLWHAPAVGQGLQDHLAVSYIYRSRVPTLNNELYPLSGKIRAALTYAFGRRGVLGMSVNQAGAFVRSRPGIDRPNMHIYFNPLSYTTTKGLTRKIMQPDPFPGLLMSFNTCRPTSRGSIDIVSSDPLKAPAIRPNSLSSAEDLADVFEGAQLLRRIAAAQPLAAVVESELQPGGRLQSREELLEDFRQRAGSVYHACGTCAMGPDPGTAVVNHRLQAHGIEALRVVDASVFPAVTSGNTNAPVIMVAEKAAELIMRA